MIKDIADFYYDTYYESTKKLSFIEDEILLEIFDCIENKIQSIDDIDTSMSVLDLIETAYNALGNSNFYIIREISVKGHESDINDFLQYSEELTARLKGLNEYFLELESLSVNRDRLDSNDVAYFNGIDAIYREEEAIKRFPNSSNRF